ncbi:MAG: PD-(D/E)XK nuclease family protein [Tractidigestivibacter sp.]|uniref:PD-(D/E)XK nuclease family protein n=1 Tax=Tractidigestivibacter sp. TaxID=2847320 RepID=UPI003D93338C
MAFQLVQTSCEGIAGVDVQRAVARARGAGGRAVLLVPSFSQALDAQRALAERNLSLGVTVTTPDAWANERWEVWGDGRHVVDDVTRSILCSQILQREEGAAKSVLSDTPGSEELLAQLARKALPWLLGASAPKGVTVAEQSVVRLVKTYADMLDEKSLVELCSVEVALPGLLKAAHVEVPPLIVSGFTKMGLPARQMLADLAQTGQVTFVVQVGESPAYNLTRQLEEQLEKDCARVGAPCARVEGASPDGVPRSAELSGVLSRIFSPVPKGEELSASGAVRLVLPAGPTAEASLVADQVAELAHEGASDIVVATPDVNAAWHQLSERLAERGVCVRAQLMVPVSQLEQGRAFLEYASSVAQLKELAETWPEDHMVEGVRAVTLGDMSWWPPRQLTDFLLSDISHVSPQRAHRLDSEWRSNRILTPAKVLEMLQLPKEGSQELAAATRELLRGRLGSAASKLLAPYVEGPLANAPTAPEARAALQAVLNVARALKELGFTADPSIEGHVELSWLVDQASRALSQTRVSLRVSRDVSGSGCTARIMSLAAAARLEPCSSDALVLMGQTSSESAISKRDDVLSALLVAYGVEPEGNAMREARATFARALAVPRKSVLVERLLHGKDHKETYPSVMLVELLSCYGIVPGTKDAKVIEQFGERFVSLRSELSVGPNASRDGKDPLPTGSETPSPAGVIDSSRRALVMPPNEGSEELGVPLLSASQVEVYLECPYKWFSLKRLKLSDSDEPFNGANLGTFAHRVLEVTHSELLARALERKRGGATLAGMRKADEHAMQERVYRDEVGNLLEIAQADPAASVAGSSVGASDEALDEALQILDEEFDAHLAHQFIPKRGGRPEYQALIAHNAFERGQIDQLKADLKSLLDYEAGLFAGFEPRFFEWDFGEEDDGLAYAGVRFRGTVDRIDVDAHGNAIVIDYKHKSTTGFSNEYDAFGPDGACANELALPRRVQALIYAQIVRRAFPNLKVRGAVYLCTKGNHELAGAIDEDLCDKVFYQHPASANRLARVAVPRSASFGVEGEAGMDALLDACESQIAQRLAELMSGDVAACPIDKQACEYCPVLNCERRAK